MTNFDLLGFAGTAIVSSYLTLCAIDEIEKDGEYTLLGYALIAVPTLIKIALRKKDSEPVPILEDPPTTNSPENVLIV